MRDDDLRRRLEQIGRLPVPEPRAEFADALFERLRGDDPMPVALVPVPSGPVIERPSRLRLVAAGAIAAAVLGVLGTFTLLRSNPSSPDYVEASSLQEGDVVEGQIRLEPGETLEVVGPDGSLEVLGGSDSGETVSVVRGTMVLDSVKIGGGQSATVDDIDAEPTDDAEAPEGDPDEAAQSGTSAANTSTGLPAPTPGAEPSAAPAAVVQGGTATLPSPTTPTVLAPPTIAVKPSTTATTKPAPTTTTTAPIPRTSLVLSGDEQGNIVDLTWSAYRGEGLDAYMLGYSYADQGEPLVSPVYPSVEGQAYWARLTNTRFPLAIPDGVDSMAVRVVAVDAVGNVLAISNDYIFERS